MAQQVERLITVSQNKVLEPEEMFDWAATTKGAPISLWGVTLATTKEYGDKYWNEFTEEQRVALAREEIAAVLDMGVRMEAILNAGLSFWIAKERNLSDPKITYALHEMAEETRHSRAFIRMREQLGPVTDNPALSGLFGKFVRGITGWVTVRPALLMIIGLAGEEIPDLFQKMSIESPETDEVLRAVSRYHRQEEARHISFARILLRDLWGGKVSLRDNLYMRYIMPRHIRLMFMGNIHPNVYKVVGLPTWSTWRKAESSDFRLGIQYDACRKVLNTLLEVGALQAGGIPRGWRKLCNVNQNGAAL